MAFRVFWEALFLAVIGLLFFCHVEGGDIKFLSASQCSVTSASGRDVEVKGEGYEIVFSGSGSFLRGKDDLSTLHVL